MSIVTIVLAFAFIAPAWTLQTSGVTARLRGVSAVDNRFAWASGSGSTVLRTEDGGASWKKITVTSDTLDFRDIDAIDEKTTYVLSIGNGDASRIYKTTDGGATWRLQFRNDDPKVFLDAMSFWDADHGLVIGDSIDRQFYLLMTSDGGQHWTRVPPNKLPPAQEREVRSAGTPPTPRPCAVSWAGLGWGPAARARVIRTSDGGRSWKVF